MEFDQFLRLNFTGPSQYEKSSPSEIGSLESDQNVPNKLVQGAKYLIAALEKFQDDPLQLARAYLIQQSLLSGPSKTLHDSIFALYEKAEPRPGLSLEKARAHLMYNEFESTKKWLNVAQKDQNFKWTLTGILGKRTKFQERDATQLIVIASSSNIDTAPQLSESNIPSRSHNSDVLLEKAQFTGQVPEEFKNIDPNNQPALDNLDVALMLLHAEYLLRSNPANDAATNEKVLAIADRIIHCPKDTVDWLLHTRALWLRSCVESHFESKSIYTMERGTLQMTDIVNALHETNGGNRLNYVHQVIPLPKWCVDSELAKRLVQIGGVGASAKIYDRLDLPVDAAVCYAAAGKNDLALERLEGYIAEHPDDARAWSLKGDLTQTPEYWEKAWSLGSYVTAKVSLGKYYQDGPQHDLEKAAAHLEEAVSANSQIHDSWFTLGCVQIQRRNMASAVTAFTQCIKLQPDDSKSWSNLGAAQIQLGNYEQALHAFDKAIRVDQNEEPNLRAWGNYITLASELRKWQIVVDGYSYMVDAKFSNQNLYIDPSILTEMTAAFIKTPFSGTSLELSFCELICNKLPKTIESEPNLWRLAAKANIWREQPWNALKNYENGWTAILESPDDSIEHFRKLVQWTGVLVDGYIGLGSLPGRVEGSKVCPDAPLKARAAVNRAMARGQAHNKSPEYARLSSFL